jgi:DNA-binding NtrC family response regulator
MVAMPSQFDEVNVLASEANWAWPLALRDIFQPRGVNLLVADSPTDFLNIIRRKRIHTAIVDMDSEKAGGLMTVKVIRMNYPLLPCLLLTSRASESLLETALRLDVFSVLEKPVNMSILLRLLDRLFMKKYNSDIFAEQKPERNL